jgi:hypothetical protein
MEPIKTIKIDKTLAKIGRSVKKRANVMFLYVATKRRCWKGRSSWRNKEGKPKRKPR